MLRKVAVSTGTIPIALGGQVVRGPRSRDQRGAVFWCLRASQAVCQCVKSRSLC